MIIGIINARGSDGYSLMIEYADGSQKELNGWYGSFEGAYNYAVEISEEGDSIENWTDDWTNEEVQDLLGIEL